MHRFPTACFKLSIFTLLCIRSNACSRATISIKNGCDNKEIHSITKTRAKLASTEHNCYNKIPNENNGCFGDVLIESKALNNLDAVLKLI